MKLSIRRRNETLCSSCSQGMVVQGHGKKLVRCNVLDALLTFPVLECSGYSPIGRMDEWEAGKIGWILEVRGGRVIGFKPPKKSD